MSQDLAGYPITMRTLIVMLLALGCCSARSQVALGQTAKQAPAPAAGEGRLYNLTPRPFTIQFHRRDGVKWTDGYVIQPGQFFSVRVPRANERNDVMGITGNGKGFVIVRYREPRLGGFMNLRLTATNPADQKLQPYWFAVEDSDGIVHLVQAAGVDEAKATQEQLKNQAPLSPSEIERMKQTLRNNWVLTD